MSIERHFGSAEDDPRITGLRLLIQDLALRSLEEQMARFNVFEAMGAVRQELRHSDFLAFLLDPGQSHGAGPAFARAFVRLAMEGSATPAPIIGPRARVQREWEHLDILLLDEECNCAVIIENKIGSGEIPGQLARYHDRVAESYRGWSIVPIYLTPARTPPSDARYHACGYDRVEQAIEKTLLPMDLSADIRFALTHYCAMLRRHVMPDTDIARLCREIYRRHGRAIDLIVQHLPPRKPQIREMLERAIAALGDRARAEDSNDTFVRFAAADWADNPALRCGRGWTHSGRVVLWEFISDGRSVRIDLVIGPAASPVRERLLAKLPSTRRLGQRSPDHWVHLYSHELVSREEGAVLGLDEYEALFLERWEGFLQDAFPKYNTLLASIAWNPE